MTFIAPLILMRTHEGGRYAVGVRAYVSLKEAVLTLPEGSNRCVAWTPG